MKNVENGVVPNQGYVEAEYDIIHNTERPGQVPYQPEELNSNNVTSRDLFIGREQGAKDFDQVTFGGDSGVVVTDNANLASNRVTPLDGAKKGEINRVQLKKDAKIMTDDVFEDQVATAMPDGIVSALEQHGYTGDLEGLRGKVESLIDDSATVDDVIDGLDDILEDFDGIPSSNDVVNVALSDLGFDGYSTVANSKVGNNSNAIVLFKKSDGSIKGVENIGDPIPTRPFDKNHPDAKKVQGKLRENYEAEVNRVNDPESAIDYDADAVKASEEAPDMDDVAELDKDLEILIESNGIDIDDLDASGFNDADKIQFEALKNTEKSFGSAGKAIMHCVIKALGRS
jgi:hypothetical protein